jgi:hypothetical protein
MPQVNQPVLPPPGAPACRACSVVPVPGDRFCRQCGTGLAQQPTPPPPAPARPEGMPAAAWPYAPRPASSTGWKPSVSIMWLNACMFWGVFPGLYLLYLTVRNIAWARSHHQPWLRYAAPLTTLVSVLVLGVLLLAQLPATQPPSYHPYVP